MRSREDLKRNRDSIGRDFALELLRHPRVERSGPTRLTNRAGGEKGGA